MYAASLMVELSRSGVGVIAVCRSGSPLDTFLAEHGIPREYLPSQRKFSTKNIRAVKNIMANADVSVLHVHYHKDIWVASPALRDDSSRRLVLSVYMGVDSKNDFLHRWVYKRVDALFTSSEELNSRLHLLYPVPAGKIHLLPYGRRLETYRLDVARRHEIRRALGVAEHDILVGTMVRIDPGKCVMDFAGSYSYLEEDVRSMARYVIIGEPTRKARSSPKESPYEPHCVAYEKEMKEFIAGNHLEERILLLGFQEKHIDYLGAMDVFVFPSRDELYSLVVLDAMCMGLPVVAARAGGNIRQVRDGENGMLFPVGDSREMARQISSYVLDPALRKAHGAAGRRFVERYHDMDATLESLKSFYAETRTNGEHSI